MKEKLKIIVKNNWLFLFMAFIIQVKSMLLLSMLRTPNYATIDLSKMYFGVPALGIHFAMITLLLSVIYLFKEKGKLRCAIIIDVIISILFLLDIWYYRNNGTFLSIRHLLHPEIFNPMGGSLFNFKLVDILFFVDFIIIFAIYKLLKPQYFKVSPNLSFRIIKSATVFVVSASIIFIGHIVIDVKGLIPGQSLFSLSWAPFQTFSDMSPLGFHGYDLKFFSNKSNKLSAEEIENIETWINNNKENIPDNNYKGMLEGKNLIAIQVESLENFVINQKVNGQEITPTLNKLLSQSLYFDNIYEQNNSGTSSDADLLVNTSIFPIRNDRTFLAYPWTSYNSLQDILNNEGYTTISTHAERGGSWNWAEPHTSFNADKLWDINSFTLDEIIGPGLSDESYLRQIAERLKSEKEPFYTFLATVTSHGPFEMPDDKKYLDLPQELDENILGAYFQSIRYADEAIKLFIESLEENGQLDNSVIMIYGDHGGVHKFYLDEIKDAPLEGDWWKADDKKIPFIIYNPSIKGEVISKAGGQSDFLPTISYLLGVDRNKFENTSMGRVLVNTNRDATILNNGDIVGTPKDEKEINHLNNIFNVADSIIEGNYFNTLKNNK